MTIPRTITELVAQIAKEMGLSSGYTRTYLQQLGYTKAEFEEADAYLRARAATADLEAARSLTERDYEEAADDDEPMYALDFIARLRSEDVLRTQAYEEAERLVEGGSVS